MRTYQNEAENLYSSMPLQEGIINRRLMQKQMGKDGKAYAAAMKTAEEDDRQEIVMRRESRGVAETNEEIVEYFMNTVAVDMDFEIVRYRPKLTEGFFKHLDNNIGALKFSMDSEDDKDTLNELEALREYLTSAVKSVDAALGAMASAKDRVAKLLSSRDKKEEILSMAEKGEIDQALMDLLAQNIQAARAAEQEDAAGFMEKVMRACAKYYVAAVKAAMPAPPSMPAASAAGATIDVEATTMVEGSFGTAPKPAAPAPGGNPGISRGGLILPGKGGAMPFKAKAAPPPPPSGNTNGGGGSGLIIPGR
ncbi:hypothetical protein FOA52_006973 [Chlamydomonas sp. UWO 241]|nr:hypothetical protein FOA52_006973 [Chlamydomonas sp. UWO 241]